MGLFNKMKTMAGGADSELLANGRLGRGFIVGIELTGTAITIGVDEYRVCQLTLQIFLDGEQPYIAQTRQRIPEWQIGQINQGGVSIAVRVDPTDPQRVAADLQTEAPVVTMSAPVSGGADEILANGTPAEVVIVANSPLGVRNYKGQDVHLFTLTVSVPGAAPYQVQLGNPLPIEALPKIFPGSKVPAKVLQNDPNSVAIDWEMALSA